MHAAYLAVVAGATPTLGLADARLCLLLPSAPLLVAPLMMMIMMVIMFFMMRRMGGMGRMGPMGGMRRMGPMGGMRRMGPMGGLDGMDMTAYMDLFRRHTELNRTVELIPGGVRTLTEATSADLAAQLQAHVASMYGHIEQGTEVTCMSDSLPTLLRSAQRYRRTLTTTPQGVAVTETSDDPRIVAAIRAHAKEVSGFVDVGMPAMMRSMMGSEG